MLDDDSLRFLLSVPPLDVVALMWFFLLWAGYNLTVDWLLQRPRGLNQHMGLVREAWMAAMLKRDDRVIDAILIGHLIHNSQRDLLCLHDHAPGRRSRRHPRRR